MLSFNKCSVLCFIALSLLVISQPCHARNKYDVVINDKARVFPGNVLLGDASDMSRPSIAEAKRDGTVVWEYVLPRSMRGPVGEINVLENGNILFTVFGKGIYEITRGKKIVWQHKDKRASHDVQRLPNGNTLYNSGWEKHGGIHVTEIDKEGKTIWEWDGLKDFDHAPYLGIDFEGWMHANAVTRLENGNTLISLRNFNTFVEVDRSGKVVHSCSLRHQGPKGLNTDGKLVGAANHSPEFIDKNTLLFATRRPNAFYEMDWKTCSPVYRWMHPDGRRAIETIRDTNRLPNGNTLVVGSVKIIEVDKSGAIVWQLNAPKSRRDNRLFHRAVVIGKDGKVYGD